ncbi:uncharacterized protein VP01_8611g2, partial [Puccinia sorghi]
MKTTPIAESLRKPDTTMDDKISTAILKTTIKAIPLWNQESLTLWRSRVENMLELQNLCKNHTEEKGILTETEELQLHALIPSKLEATVHANLSMSSGTIQTYHVSLLKLKPALASSVVVILFFTYIIAANTQGLRNSLKGPQNQDQKPILPQ